MIDTKFSKSLIGRQFAWLKKRLPTKRPASLRCDDIDSPAECAGTCITLRSDLSDLETSEMVIHEYAHALCYDPNDVRYLFATDDFDWHDDEWGIAYAKCYRVATLMPFVAMHEELVATRKAELEEMGIREPFSVAEHELSWGQNSK